MLVALFVFVKAFIFHDIKFLIKLSISRARDVTGFATRFTQFQIKMTPKRLYQIKILSLTAGRTVLKIAPAFELIVEDVIDDVCAHFQGLLAHFGRIVVYFGIFPSIAQISFISIKQH